MSSWWRPNFPLATVSVGSRQWNASSSPRRRIGAPPKLGMIDNHGSPGIVGRLRDNCQMRQLQLFTSAALAGMRDRSASRNFSPERDTFRRDHERHRTWGLAQRHGERLRRGRLGRGASQAVDAHDAGRPRPLPVPVPATSATATMVPVAVPAPVAAPLQAPASVPVPVTVPASALVPASNRAAAPTPAMAPASALTPATAPTPAPP